jgi:ABC-type transporter lipoprotein component MlaA
VIALTETMLSQAKSSDESALKASIDKYEEIRAAYNQSDDELQALLKQLAAMVRSR